MATQQLLAGSWRRGLQGLATLTVLAVMLMVLAAPPATAAGVYSPGSDMGSLYHTTLMTGAVTGRYAGDAANFLGVAPDARIVSLKAADAVGATDVTQIIAAIDWVVEHKTSNGLNIRVLNLSFGTDSRQLPKIDPLAHAVERAWKHGIVVVVSAGNAGFNMANGGPGLTNPARDPYVISVGASDPRGTTTVADDALPASRPAGCPGPPAARPRTCWLRVSRWLACGCPGRSWTRASGTPPSWARTTSADRGPARPPRSSPERPPSTKQSYDTATGAGSLEASRGTPRLVDGVELRGELDTTGTAVSTAALANQRLSGRMWSWGGWTGRRWSGRMWSGDVWSSASWN